MTEEEVEEDMEAQEEVLEEEMMVFNIIFLQQLSHAQ